jgi:predicted small metal-binding protein
MRRARPYCGENPEPGKDVTESLTPRPELENGQDPNRTSTGRFCCDALCVPVMERFGPQGREEKMGRKFIDCREFPSEMNCTLALSADNEDELLEAAVQHAITVHGHEDTPDLRTMIRTAMRDGTPPVEAPRRAA